MTKSNTKKDGFVQARLTRSQAERFYKVAEENGLTRSEAFRSIIFEFISNPSKFPIANLSLRPTEGSRKQ